MAGSYSGWDVCRFGPIYADGNVAEMNTVVILQKELSTLHIFFTEMLLLERLDPIIRSLHFIDNSTVNKYQGPAKLSEFI
jgi:hypothetical protein